MNLIDKNIHKHEFRLRILLTNECNANCMHCLNDFQDKGQDYISTFLVADMIKKYVLFCAAIEVKPIVSFSGGEPGLHPDFAEIIDNAKRYRGLKIQVNTNGKVDDLIWDRSKIDIRYHMGLGLPNHAHNGQTAVFVIGESHKIEDIIDTLTLFYNKGMKVKTFADFYASAVFHEVYYPLLLSKINEIVPVTGRFTGIQTNRGSGCINCEKACVTLKALWVFPDGTCSPCPQRNVFRKYPDEVTFWNAYNFHTF